MEQISDNQQFLDRDQINRAVERLQRRGAQVVQAAKRALEEGAGSIVNDAKSRAPVKTGKLRDSIHYTVTNDGGAVEISADVPYAKIVEYSPKINHPFLKPAIDAQKSRVNQLIKQAIEDSAER